MGIGKLLGGLALGVGTVIAAPVVLPAVAVGGGVVSATAAYHEKAIESAEQKGYERGIKSGAEGLKAEKEAHRREKDAWDEEVKLKDEEIKSKDEKIKVQSDYIDEQDDFINEMLKNKGE